MNIFDNIGKWYNYLASGQLWSDIYGTTHNNRDDTKLADVVTHLSWLGYDQNSINDVIGKLDDQWAFSTQWNFQLPTSKWFKMHETIPWSAYAESLKMPINPINTISDVPQAVWKTIFNALPSAYQLGAWIANAGSTFVQEWVKWALQWDAMAWQKALYNTAVSSLVNPSISWAQNMWNDFADTYNQKWLLPAISQWLNTAIKFTWENPALVWPMAKWFLRPVETLGKNVWENPYVSPILSKWVEIWSNVVNKIPNPLPSKEGIQNMWNSVAEWILAKMWKLDKWTRDKLAWQIGQTWPKFALQNDLVWPTIEATADNAGLFKTEKIQEKLNAVKEFGDIVTPDVAKNVANVLKNDIIDSVEKSYWKGTDTMKALEENHPELAQVLNLTNEVSNSSKVSYLKLEQLKELHDYLNPENIQYDISGKPISETRNILSAGKRSKLQQILEEAGNKNGVDIKWINKSIQGAHQLEKWLNNSVSRIQNLNILWLGDTQVAMISSILGWAPGAVWSIFLKKWLQSEWLRAWIAKKLFTKTPQDVTTNSLNNPGTMTPPITRMGRIMNNSDSVPPSKVEAKPIIVPKKTTGIIRDPRVQGDSKVTPIVKKEPKNTIVKPKGDIPKELQWLAEEARKYPDMRSFELAVYGNESQKPQISWLNHNIIDHIINPLDIRSEKRSFELWGWYWKDSPWSIKYFSVDHMPNKNIYFPNWITEYTAIYRWWKSWAKKLASLRDWEYATTSKQVAKKYAGYWWEVKEYKVKTRDLLFDPKENGDYWFNVINNPWKTLNILEKKLWWNAKDFYIKANSLNNSNKSLTK